MHPSIRRRFGIRGASSLAIATLLVLISQGGSRAQQNLDANVLQTPQVFSFAPPPTITAPSAPQIDPSSLIRIPVTVLDDAGHAVQSLTAGDFSLNVDGEESPIAWFRPNRATNAALGVLVDISQSMEFKSFSGRIFSKLPMVQGAIKTVVDRIDAHDNIFLATFARRFHMLDDFTTNHGDLEERAAMLRVTDQLDDFDGSGIYESMMKGITVLGHAPKSCDRRALLVFTNAYLDTSNHGVDDVIAKAQFAGVTIYNIIVLGFPIESDVASVQRGMGRIAAETGGLTFIVNGRTESERLVSATDEIVSELDNQYLLGFSVSQWSPGALPVELMVPHHPGMQVRAPHVVRFRPQDLVR
jgi:VWFA-related protein